ncbi:MAG: MFS transporter [Immundisolibacteraceae bacterium]|nr:MFS transporter [Immundisolibacteraceae bacterium]
MKPIKSQSNTRIILALGLGAGLIPLNSTTIAVALPAIGIHFGADDSLLSQWLIVSYLLVSVLFLSPAGKLGDLWGHGKLLRTGWLMFLIGALIGSFAVSISQLVISRVVMGLGSALLMPSSIAVVRNSVSPEQRAPALGMLAGGLAVSAALGPPVGGFLIHHFGWQSVFWLNLPVLAISAWLARDLDLPVPDKSDTPLKFDWPGSAMLIGLLACFVIGVRVSDSTGTLLLVSSAVLAALFVSWEIRQREPVLDVRLFRVRAFTCAILVIAVQNFGMYGVLFQMPYLLNELYQSPANQVGLMMLVTTAGMAICSPLGGRLANRITNRWTALLGSLCGLTGMTGLALASDWSALLPISPWLFLVGAGLGLNTGPAQATVLSAVQEKDAGMASGALSVMRYLGSITGIALLGFLLAQTEIPGIPRYQMGFQIYGSAFLLCALLSLGMKLPRSEHG